MANRSSPASPFDVFISAKSEDFPLAREVHKFLVAHGLKVFFSEVSVPEVGDSEYGRTIEDAINRSSHMVVVASSVENLESRWVRFEWSMFNNFKLSGKKEGGSLVTLMAGCLSERDLPGTLGIHQALPYSAGQLGKLLPFLSKGSEKIGSAAAPKGKDRRLWMARAKAGVVVTAVLGLLLIVGLSLRFVHPSVQGSASRADRQFEETRDSLFGAMPWLTWVVYDPTEYDPFNRPMPSEASIRKDLEVLAEHGFKGLITMTSKGACREIARVARQLGFVKIVVGVWDIRDQGEVGNALSASAWADAYCVGHRGAEQRYSLGELETAVARFRRETHRPSTTSEALATYESNPAYVALGDFLFPDVHTYWHDGQSPAAAWQQTVTFARQAEVLAAKESNESGRPKKPVLLKMVSFPSGGATGLTEASQLEFYRLAIRESPMKGDLPGGVSLAFFSAFDEPWKTAERGFAAPELSTGLFRTSRQPKHAVTKLDWSRKFR